MMGLGGEAFERYANLDAARDFNPKKRLGIVGDRDFFNVWNLADNFLRRDYSSTLNLSLGALVVLGGEFDYYILKIVQFMGDKSGDEVVGMPVDLNNGTIGMHFLSSKVDFYFLHHPLNPQGLKKDPDYRRKWSSDLADLMDFTHCGRILLANNKIILDPEFVKRREKEIVNVHPSILPEDKGWRTERKALVNQTPDSAGWTAHNVDIELDRGATIAFQNIPLEPGSENFGNSGNEDDLEERQRLRGIRAQALWLPEILNLHFSDTPRIIVRGSEAYVREGRGEFVDSQSYNGLMEAGERPDQYGRFLYGRERLLAEAIIGIPPAAPYERVNKLARYTYEIPATGIEGVRIQYELMDFANSLCKRSVYHTESLAMADSRFRGSLLTLSDLSGELERRGINYEVEEFPTRVVGSRKEIRWVQEDYAIP